MSSIESCALSNKTHKKKKVIAFANHFTGCNTKCDIWCTYSYFADNQLSLKCQNVLVVAIVFYKYIDVFEHDKVQILNDLQMKDVS